MAVAVARAVFRGTLGPGQHRPELGSGFGVSLGGRGEPLGKQKKTCNRGQRREA